MAASVAAHVAASVAAHVAASVAERVAAVLVPALAAALLAGGPGSLQARAAEGGGGFAFEIDRSGSRAATASHRSPWRATGQARTAPGAAKAHGQAKAHDAANVHDTGKGHDAARVHDPATAKEPARPPDRAGAPTRATGLRADPGSAAVRATSGVRKGQRRRKAGHPTLPDTWEGHRRVGDAFYVERDGTLLWADTFEPVNPWTLPEPVP